MAFTLSKNDCITRDEIVDRLRKAQEELEEAIETANTALEEMRENIEAAVGEYNKALGYAEVFRTDVVGRIQTEFDDKSEKWQEGDAGQAAQVFIEEWEGLDLEEIGVDTVGDFVSPGMDHAEGFEEAPVEV